MAIDSKMLALFSIAALGGSPVFNGAGTSAADDAQSETPANIIAAQIRKQGFKCNNDKHLSKPDLPVWILTCEDATYRVRLIGNMADRVEKLDHDAGRPMQRRPR